MRMRRMRFPKRLAVLGVAALLTLALVEPPVASAASCSASKCGKGQTRTKLDSKTCKANKKRPAIVITRACCRKSNGKVRCKAFPQCPKKSPSTSCT